MKTLFFIAGLCFIGTANAQYNPSQSMTNDFKDISTFSKRGRQSGMEGIQTYSTGNIKGSQFFYPTFTDGSVTTSNNEVISKIYQFLFDKVRQELFIISKNDKKEPPEILLADKTQIKSFAITTDRDHLFMPAHNYVPENNTDFYEVLERNDAGYSLLKFVRTTFVKNDPGDIAKMKRGDIYDEFVDKTTYYISYKMAIPQPITLKKNKILNAFPASEKAAVENYFAAHTQDDINEQFVIDLVKTINR